MEFNELNVEFGYAYESAAVVPDGSPPPRPVDDIRVYEPRRDRERRCRTPGSRTRTDSGGRSRTWSPPGASCSSPAKRAARGARPPGGSPPRPASRSTRSASATSTATCTTRAACGCAPRDRARRSGAGSPGPVRRLAQPAGVGGPARRAVGRAEPDPRPAGGRPRRDRLTHLPFPRGRSRGRDSQPPWAQVARAGPGRRRARDGGARLRGGHDRARRGGGGDPAQLGLPLLRLQGRDPARGHGARRGALLRRHAGVAGPQRAPRAAPGPGSSRALPRRSSATPTSCVC